MQPLQTDLSVFNKLNPAKALSVSSFSSLNLMGSNRILRTKK
jgi:hypothetical protein